MNDDPIVNEIREARGRILERCGGDLYKWFEHLKAAEAKHPDRVVTLEDLRAKRRASGID